MKKIITILLAIVFCWPLSAQKKVYADYHGIRRTRTVDGDFGEWKYFSKLTNNATGVTQLTYNPDLILPNGQNNIASVDYPLVGMQSQFDHANLEYQILSAKAAGIDGFFIEWGYIDHTSNALLKEAVEIAKKYHFEIGVNVCDGWLMEKNWYPGTREEKIQYFITCMQYLIDNVLTGQTAPLVNGKPVFYLFHDGFTADEFKTIREYNYSYPADYPVKEGDKFPQVLMRTMLNPTLVNGVYTPKSPLTQAGQNWVNTNKVIPSAWMPERIRDGKTLYPKYNRYATSEDCQTFLKAFADNIWRMDFPVKSGYVSPGMDNYGCGGWSATGKLSYIPRDGGKTYNDMWEFNLKYKNLLHMVYIGSWNDYTEGHEIEPTVENGDRDLRTTLKYASQFKDESSYDESGINLPYELFQLRKQQEFFTLCNIESGNLTGQLDAIAGKISSKAYTEASTLIDQVKETFNAVSAKIAEKKYLVNGSGINITGNKNAEGEYILSTSKTGITIKDAALKAELASQNYEGYLNYEYWDDTWGNNTNITSETDRTPKDLFKFVAQIKDEGLKQWKTARIRLYKENIKYTTGSGSDLSLYGGSTQTSKIRNVSFDFTVFTPGIASSVTDPANETGVKTYFTNGTLFIRLGNNAGTDNRLYIYSQDGRAVYTQKLTEQKTSIGLSTLAKGVYILRIETEGQSYTNKFIR